MTILQYTGLQAKYFKFPSVIVKCKIYCNVFDNQKVKKIENPYIEQVLKRVKNY